MTAVPTRALRTLMVSMALGACDHAPQTITTPLMISQGVVVSQRMQDRQNDSTIAAASYTGVVTETRIIATGTLVMRGDPTRLFHAWKSLTARPTVRCAESRVTAQDAWNNSILVTPVLITDEIPCCFLAWQRNSMAGSQWLDGEAWFHGCQHRPIDPLYTDVHLTLMCDSTPTANEAEQGERVSQLEKRLRSQLLSFKTLVNG